MADNQRCKERFIQRLEMKTFASDEDRMNFFDELKRGLDPPSKRDPLTIKDQAYNMILDAQGLPADKGKNLAIKALSLDPESIEALAYLGSILPNKESVPYLKKGIHLGEKLFGDDYLKENTGIFWNIPETRPFMECLNGYAVALYDMNSFAAAIPLFERVLELNLNDDMGARRNLMLSLIQMNDFRKFKKYDDYFQDDDLQQLFNRTLLTYKTSGDNENSRKLLHLANNKNKYVVPGLISNSEIKRFPSFDMEEMDFVMAFEYLVKAKKIWILTDGATNWIRKNIDNLEANA